MPYHSITPGEPWKAAAHRNRSTKVNSNAISIHSCSMQTYILMESLPQWWCIQPMKQLATQRFLPEIEVSCKFLHQTLGCCVTQPFICNTKSHWPRICDSSLQSTVPKKMELHNNTWIVRKTKYRNKFMPTTYTDGWPVIGFESWPETLEWNHGQLEIYTCPVYQSKIRWFNKTANVKETWNNTLLETSVPSEHRVGPKRKLILQPSIFRCYCWWKKNLHHLGCIKPCK